VQIAPQLLEMVAGRHPQVLIRRRIVYHLELAEDAGFEIGWGVANVIGSTGQTGPLPGSPAHC
jgi:hypothetical protein